MVAESPALPPIDVSSLGSFVFCQRAGVIAFKKQGTNEDGNEEEPRIANLSYLPEFCDIGLREKFEQIFPTLLCYWGVILVWFFIVAILSRTGFLLLSIILLAAMLPIAIKAFNDTILVIEILAELARYKNKPVTPLDPNATQPVEITWWGLRKAGFDAIRPGAALKDPDLHLNGKPWRVLSNNDGVRIPVINSNTEKLIVRDSHRIRLAAYSHLLETEQRATSDWGVIVDMETKKGYAIPIGVALRSEALVMLERFREVLEDDERNVQLKIPVASPCENCRFGKPRPYVKGESETTYRTGPIGARVENGHGDVKVHSDCGDEFEWRPMHNYW